MHLDAPLGGYTYWMAFTPYPSDVNENPSIVASNDGLTWIVPAGLTNPLDPIAGDPAMVNNSLYNSDTELVHVDGTLYLIWRRYHSGTATFYLRRSTNGVDWTPRETLWDGTPTNEGAVSPFVIYEPADGDTPALWRLYYGNGTNIQMRTAPDITGPWSARQDCVIGGLESWRGWWHFDAVKHDDLYVGFFSATEKGSTNLRGTLYLAASRDGLHWEVAQAAVQGLNPAPGFLRTWDSNIIYRCTGLVEGSTIRIWYSAMPGIGYAEMPLASLQTALDRLP